VAVGETSKGVSVFVVLPLVVDCSTPPGRCEYNAMGLINSVPGRGGPRWNIETWEKWLD